MKNARILVVDDEEIVRESCRRALTDAGYAVRTAAGGRDALQACREESFDVMLTDLRMPDMDGIDVIRAATQELPELRVVIITGYPSRQSVEQAANLGIFDYLEKPLSPGRLSEAIAAVLARPLRRTAPAADEPVPTEAKSREVEKTELEEVVTTPQKKTPNRTRQGALIALGFLIGVTVAYVIAPSHTLAWLVLGTAIASGTLFGVFSDAFFTKSNQS